MYVIWDIVPLGSWLMVPLYPVCVEVLHVLWLGCGMSWHGLPVSCYIPQADELSFEEGDLLYVKEMTGDWWKATCGGKNGLIPSNYGNTITNSLHGLSSYFTNQSSHWQWVFDAVLLAVPLVYEEYWIFVPGFLPYPNCVTHNVLQTLCSGVNRCNVY